MKRSQTRFLLLASLFVLFLAGIGDAQKAVRKSSKQLLRKCYSGSAVLPCPKNYKVVLTGRSRDGIFAARHNEFSYGVFAVIGDDNRDPKIREDQVLSQILVAFYPKEVKRFIWKEVEADKRPSSKFESQKRRILGYNGNLLITVDFRQVKLKQGSLLVGTLVDGFTSGAAAASDFDIGRVTTNGGCYDAQQIIRYLTGEKESDDYDPCGFTLRRT